MTVVVMLMISMMSTATSPIASNSGWQVVDNNLDSDCDDEADNDDSGCDAFGKPTSCMYDMINVDKVWCDLLTSYKCKWKYNVWSDLS